MIKRVKKWLGIEGVKIELKIPEKVKADAGVIDGKLKFTSLNDQIVREIRLRLIEKYSRGRKKNKLTDEYTLGEILIKEDVEVLANQVIEVDFELPFVLSKSEMDLLQEQNFLTRGLVKLAKSIRAVKSVYRVEAEAKVKGTKFHPFDTKDLILK
jgi:hypothetical protein